MQAYLVLYDYDEFSTVDSFLTSTLTEKDSAYTSGRMYLRLGIITNKKLSRTTGNTSAKVIPIAYFSDL